MLLRNVNPQAGLLNGTRLLITQLGSKVLQAKILTGSRAWDKVFIPRINLSTASDSGLPFTLNRKQFPVKLSYAVTINKSQGQTLSKVGIFFCQHLSLPMVSCTLRHRASEVTSGCTLCWDIPTNPRMISLDILPMWFIGRPSSSDGE